MYDVVVVGNAYDFMTVGKAFDSHGGWQRIRIFMAVGNVEGTSLLVARI